MTSVHLCGRVLTLPPKHSPTESKEITRQVERLTIHQLWDLQREDLFLVPSGKRSLLRETGPWGRILPGSDIRL